MAILVIPQGLQEAIASLKLITSWTNPAFVALALSAFKLLNTFNSTEANKIFFVNSQAMAQLSRIALLANVPLDVRVGFGNVILVFNSNTPNPLMLQMRTLIFNNPQLLQDYRGLQFALVYTLQSLLVVQPTLPSIYWTPVSEDTAVTNLPAIESILSALSINMFGNPVGLNGICWYSSYRMDQLVYYACNFFCSESSVTIWSLSVAQSSLQILLFMGQSALVSQMLDTQPFGPLYPLPKYESFVPGTSDAQVPPTLADFKGQGLAQPMIQSVLQILYVFSPCTTDVDAPPLLAQEDCIVASKCLLVLFANSTFVQSPAWPTVPGIIDDTLDALNNTFKSTWTNGLDSVYKNASLSLQYWPLVSQVMVLMERCTMNSDQMQQALYLTTYILGCVNATFVNRNVSIFTFGIQDIPRIQGHLKIILNATVSLWTTFCTRNILTLSAYAFDGPEVPLVPGSSAVYTIGTLQVSMLSPVTSLGIMLSGGLNMQPGVPGTTYNGEGLHELFVGSNSFQFIQALMPLYASNGFNFTSVLPGITTVAIPDKEAGASPNELPPYQAPYVVLTPVTANVSNYSVPGTEPLVGSVWFYALAYVGLKSIVNNSTVQNTNASIGSCFLSAHFAYSSVYYKAWLVFWSTITILSVSLQSSNVQLRTFAQFALAILGQP